MASEFHILFRLLVPQVSHPNQLHLSILSNRSSFLCIYLTYILFLIKLGVKTSQNTTIHTVHTIGLVLARLQGSGSPDVTSHQVFRDQLLLNCAQHLLETVTVEPKKRRVTLPPLLKYFGGW